MSLICSNCGCEIDSAGCDDSNAETLCNIADEQIFIKTDGSLDEGMEIVTHPMTLEYHCHTMPWKEITSKAISIGYLSHKTSTCGLHVHVNRNAFGSDRYEQDMVVSRILFFIERFWQEMLKFSRRTEQQINHWAARYGIKDNPQQVMDNAKSTGKGRYACINLCNYYTIEFRIFRGTLKYNTLIATLQMVERICNTAMQLSDSEMTTKGSEDKNCNNHPFYGKASGVRFALAHNGVLYNDEEIRKSMRLPATSIETDSYIAVQLLEHYGEISFDSIAKMAETVCGSFCFSILTDSKELYLVKGSNPLAIYDCGGYYIYASTSDILDRALKRLRIRKKSNVEIRSGEILKISADFLFVQLVISL
ncbi:MAG: amidoligase family protein [Oscillospiraceae bacterium]